MLRRGDDGSAPDPIAAALALAHAGLGLLKAKRTVEAAIERKRSADALCGAG